MFHVQRTVPGWLEAVELLPNGSQIKATEDYQIFREVKAINPKITTVVRMVRDNWQVYTGRPDSGWFNWDTATANAREWFNAHVDGTFYEQIADYCDAVSWHNEIWALSQNEVEVNERIAATEAAIYVWNNEYRPKFSNDIQLIVGEAAVGNDMPRRVAELAIESDNLLGYHPYEYWLSKVRTDEAWRESTSMRWDFMEYQWDLKPTWIFTEAGPLEGPVTGWRSSKCLGGDRALYVEAVKLWIRDVAARPAYREGRIRGFALFTTYDPKSSSFGSFHTAQPELNMLAQMIAQEWKPGSKPAEKRIRIKESANIRLTQYYTGVAGQHNRIMTLTPGSELRYVDTFDNGDEFRGSTKWYQVGVDVSWLDGMVSDLAYVHSALAEIV